MNNYERLAVIGSRSFPKENTPILIKILDAFYDKFKPKWFISGFAEGADKISELEWAIPKNLSRMIFRPDYSKHGKGAPLIRNTEIIKNADYVIAFTNGSRGTQDAINKAKKFNKPFIVFDFDGKIIEKYEGMQ